MPTFDPVVEPSTTYPESLGHPSNRLPPSITKIAAIRRHSVASSVFRQARRSRARCMSFNHNPSRVYLPDEENYCISHSVKGLLITRLVTLTSIVAKEHVQLKLLARAFHNPICRVPKTDVPRVVEPQLTANIDRPLLHHQKSDT